MRTTIHRMVVVPVCLLCSALFLTPAFGASISISGTVKDSDGKPLGGAEVYAVAEPKVKTTSGADGAFSLSGTILDAPAQSGAPEKPGAVARTPIAAAKAGYMTAQVLSQVLATKGLQFKLFPSITGATVTLKGFVMNQNHVKEDAEWDNKTHKGKIQFVFLVVHDGPPGIKAEWDQIWSDYYPEESLSGDAAKELERQFKTRLFYYIDGPMADKLSKGCKYGASAMSITGVVHEDELSKKWITPSATESYKGPNYPDRVTAPDQPLVKLPVKPGLALKLTDTLTDTLMYVPAGKFYMGCPLEGGGHGDEACQHMVTFARGFYLSDHPILNSEYAAVTGDNTGNPKNYPGDAAMNISCVQFNAYVKALEKLNPGKVIRAPRKAEWEYAARSGTSNLEFLSNRNSKAGETCNRTIAVKSKKPNGWGFYGMVFSDGNERSSDQGCYSCETYIPDMADPQFPNTACMKNPADPSNKHIHATGCDWITFNWNDNGNVGTELGGNQRNGGKMLILRQRILVEE